MIYLLLEDFNIWFTEACNRARESKASFREVDKNYTTALIVGLKARFA